MPRVRADIEMCEGYGNCVQSAPSVFDMDDDDVVVVLQEHIGEDRRAEAEEAALARPVRAISLASD